MSTKKLRLGLIGLGGQGHAHAKTLAKVPADFPLELVAVCDVRPEQFQKQDIAFNLAEGRGEVGFEQFHCYTSVDDMIAKEQLDMVTVVVPTYLHREITNKCLRAGIHVLCEKPMALNPEECEDMIRTAKECGKQLMIGQCLRFWDEYRILKSMIDSGELGKVRSGMFWRSGDTPSWSYQNWMLHKELGGGAIFDQHIHDTDMVQYLFGVPDAVSTQAKVVHEGCNYEETCTNYIYKDGPMLFSHNDWTLALPFGHGFRVNFEKGTLEMGPLGLRLARRDGTPVEKVEFQRTSALANEMRYLAECILGERVNTTNLPESSMLSVRIALAEIASADRNAEPVKL